MVEQLLRPFKKGTIKSLYCLIGNHNIAVATARFGAEEEGWKVEAIRLL